jgi:hypothetical protein
MGIERHRITRSGADVRHRQQELLRSLHAAVDTLSLCVDRIQDLILAVDRQLTVGGEPAAPQRPLEVSFGGGPSVIDARDSERAGESAIGSDERRRSSERRAGIEERRAGIEERRGDVARRAPRRNEAPAPGTPALMAATEMAHLGYSREEIAERLRARWGDRAAAILREALD